MIPMQEQDWVSNGESGGRAAQQAFIPTWAK
jgi:hypothetical protein